MGKRILAFLIDHIIICFAFALLGMVEMFVKTDFELFWKMYYIFLLVFMVKSAILSLCFFFNKQKRQALTAEGLPANDHGHYISRIKNTYKLI